MYKMKFVLLFVSAICFSQQSYSLQDCELAFKQNNLELLAQEYNINQAEADIIQAKIWDLPQLGFTTNLYHPQPSQFFNVGPSKNIELTQLFLLGGKRQMRIDLAKSNKELAKLQYQQWLVDLNFRLKESFYSLYFDHLKLNGLEKQLVYLQDLLKAYKLQTAKGNIALKDEVRLSSMVMALTEDLVQLKKNISEEQNVLKTLTGFQDEIIPQMLSDQQDQLRKEPMFSLEEIQRKALENNADYLSGLLLVNNSQLNEKYQKSLNIPDLTGGLQWNQNSGYFKNEINFTLSIPLPLWRQNEGNVQKAKFQTLQSQKILEQKKRTLENQIASAYQQWQLQYQQFKNISATDLDNLEMVYKGMTDNFRKGNVTLLEFTDFAESYKQSVLQINEIKKQLLIATQEINRLVQTPIF